MNIDHGGIYICSGYMAPEYALHGLISVKSDVFSFGVLLLEIVSGQKITSFYQSASCPDLLSYVSMKVLMNSHTSSVIIGIYLNYLRYLTTGMEKMERRYIFRVDGSNFSRRFYEK